MEHGNVLLILHIPLVMLRAHWGQTYSIDALLKKRAGRTTPSPTDNSWQHIWPSRVLLILLVMFFMSATLTKLEAGFFRDLPQFLDFGPWRFRANVVDRDRRDAAPVVDAGHQIEAVGVRCQVRRRFWFICTGLTADRAFCPGC